MSRAAQNLFHSKILNFDHWPSGHCIIKTHWSDIDFTGPNLIFVLIWKPLCCLVCFITGLNNQGKLFLVFFLNYFWSNSHWPTGPVDMETPLPRHASKLPTSGSGPLVNFADWSASCYRLLLNFNNNFNLGRNV